MGTMLPKLFHSTSATTLTTPQLRLLLALLDALFFDFYSDNGRGSYKIQKEPEASQESEKVKFVK